MDNREASPTDQATIQTYQRRPKRKQRDDTAEIEGSNKPETQGKTPSPPDFAAGKTSKGILKKINDGKQSSEENNVTFGSVNCRKIIASSLDKNIEMAYKTDKTIGLEHTKIFLETYKEIKEIYSNPGSLLDQVEILKRSGITPQRCTLLINSFNKIVKKFHASPEGFGV